MRKFTRGFFKFLLTTILLITMVYSYSKYLEPNMLKVKEIQLEPSPFSLNERELTIAVFSDTHFGYHYDLQDFNKVVEKINEKKPDIIIFAGDLIDSFNQFQGDVEVLSQALANIRSTFGKFAVFGNHDYGGGAERQYTTIMERGGFSVLKNEYFPIDSMGIAIIGIDDYLIGYGKSDIASWARPDFYNIAISHAPDVVDEVMDYNIDLMVSGHTHGRQVNIPPLQSYILPPMGKKYPKGLYTFENHRNTLLYVNSGLGTTQLPVRFLSPPELTFISLPASLLHN